MPTPDALQVALTLLTLAVTTVALVKVVIPVTRWAWSVGSRFMGAIDNIAGRDARVDRATGKTIEAIPPIHDRFAGIESKLDGLANTDARFERLESRVDIVEATQAALIGGTFERGAEAVLKAVEKTTIDVDAD